MMLQGSNSLLRPADHPAARTAVGRLCDGDSDGELARILAPTTMSEREQPAIRLGFQLAAATGARLTVLHVLPVPEPAPEDARSLHWLDAIDSLHRDLFARGDAPMRSRRELLDDARRRLADFVERLVPESWRLQADVRLECQCGDVVDEIARCAVAESADLVILTSALSRWRLPLVPGRLHRVLQSLRSRVIVVRPAAGGDEAARSRTAAEIDH